MTPQNIAPVDFNNPQDASLHIEINANSCLEKNKMVLQYKGVIKRVFVLLFLICPFVKPQQLALPKDVEANIETHSISVKELSKRYSDYFFLSSKKDNTTISHSILNNIVGEYQLLLDNVTLSSIAQIGFLNNQSHLAIVLNVEKFFLFQPTNFII